MAVFKCKMCGGTIEFKPGDTVGVCDSCGTKQTLPRLDDDRRANLYDRANHFRRANDFDKAAGLYEQILTEDNTDAEAYWSLVLCRYGIEYVEDPATHKRVPTVNRAQFTSILADEDYKSALKYADVAQRELYEQEAHAIDEIQKGILAISQKEEPFDVFICYKEADDNGRRTPDSVLANDLYHQLTLEGFKVFYARITLEDKLGTAYEPYIFAALNSAKVMVVLGTKPEYFRAVWVKNEWSRYLKLVKSSGGKKVLIPAFKDMDPYDLPEEFSHLQAQDMSKLGFMQDLIRGIKKIIAADEPKGAKETVVVTSGAADTAPLLKRAFMFLEDGNWDSANEYCEKVLDRDPENARAYLGKLMADLRVRKQADLSRQSKPFENNSNYEKIMRFGDEALKAELKDDIKQIKLEKAREKVVAYDPTRRCDFETGINWNTEALSLLESIPGWKDADALAAECRVNIDEFSAAQERARQKAAEEKRRAEEAAAAEQRRRAEEARRKAEETKRKTKKALKIAIPSICIVIALALVFKFFIYPPIKYNQEINAIHSAQVGDEVIYGSYHGDIEWRVLDVQDGKALLISKYALDAKPYNETNTAVRWETCTLRQWLNSDFLNEAFSEKEQSSIETATVTADKNPDYYTDPGNDTKDKVFLLSVDEAEKYFSSDDDRACSPTDYAIANGAKVDDKGSCWWWLRTKGGLSNTATNITAYRLISNTGMPVIRQDGAVRPVIWIDTSKV